MEGRRREDQSLDDFISSQPVSYAKTWMAYDTD